MRRNRAWCWLTGVLAGLSIGLAALALRLPASAQTFDRSAVVMRDGNPTLLVDGRPFFFYGAAFFYERIPAAQWRPSMLALRRLGFNTLDLYVPWNWHELADGEFDFDGHTNARRNFRAVLGLARELQFKLIVRPGPVIRNEWRNGGYPAWLLTRPQYGMPLHDVLEGRYPATATLQNANSDDAAAQWLNNTTHMKYASRWLRRVLRECTPVADLVIAIALDDDQGAYIDNQTWPAPHLQQYLRTLQTIVRGVTGSKLPLFINTYEMKVTASAPVWAMGNWYQSDAYSIGEHDRAALEFSTGLLQTQTRYPVAMSEFGAGWLAPPEDPAPRPADPTNTTLALHALLGLGMRGVVVFPAQDTTNPAGWEAPFANAAYAWGAALDVALVPSPRAAPTARFGALLRAQGSALAGAHRLADGAIAYLTSAYDATRVTNTDVFAIVARTQQAQQRCRARRLTCDLVDLRFTSDTALRRYPFLVVSRAPGAPPLVALARERLRRYVRSGGRVVTQAPDVVSPRAGGIPDATLLLAHDGRALLDVVNFDAVPHHIAATVLRLPSGASWTIGATRIPPRDAVLLVYKPRSQRARQDSATRLAAPAMPVALHRSAHTGCVATPSRSGSRSAAPDVVEDDRAADGYQRLTLSNAFVSLTLAPAAGARAFTFVALNGKCPPINVFTSVGALRDDVGIQSPLSQTDRIGKYTRSFPAGFFNRLYRTSAAEKTATAASVTLMYDAPDVVPHGARFERTLRIAANEPAFTITQRAMFYDPAASGAQRAVRYDSFNMDGATLIDERRNGAVGFYYAASRHVAIVAWPLADVEDARLMPQRTSTVLRLQFAPSSPTSTRYALDAANGLDAARMMVVKERAAAAAKS